MNLVLRGPLCKLRHALPVVQDWRRLPTPGQQEDGVGRGPERAVLVFRKEGRSQVSGHTPKLDTGPKRGQGHMCPTPRPREHLAEPTFPVGEARGPDRKLGG